MTPLTVKNGIFKKCQKYSISYGTRFSQPKYNIPTWKTMTGKNRKMSIKSLKMKISTKKKKCVSFSCPKDHSSQKLGS